MNEPRNGTDGHLDLWNFQLRVVLNSESGVGRRLRIREPGGTHRTLRFVVTRVQCRTATSGSVCSSKFI